MKRDDDMAPWYAFEPRTWWGNAILWCVIFWCLGSGLYTLALALHRVLN